MPTPIFNADLGFFNTLIEVGVTMRTVYGFTSDNVTYTREPPWKGDGYIAGDDPDGLVTFNGAPAVREIELWDRATSTHVATTESAADGTYSFIGVSRDRLFDVIARGANGTENDVIAARVTASAQPLTVDSIADQSLHVGDVRTIDLRARFGFPPYTWSVSGAAWASVTDSVLTLAPDSESTGTLAVTVTDSHSGTKSIDFNATVLEQGSYKYWRINIAASNGDVNFSIAEVGLFETGSATNLASSAGASATSTYSSGYLASYAADGSSASRWAANGAESPPFGLAFNVGSMKKVTKVTIQAPNNSPPTNSPKDFTIQASDDGGVWIDQWSVSGQTGWSVSEIRTFNRP